MSGMRFDAMQVDGDTKFVFAVDPTTINDLYDFQNVTGSMEDLSKLNSIAVDKKVAEDNGWTIGTTIDVTFASETTSMEIVTLIDGAKAFGNWAMGIPTYELHFADQFDSQVFIKLTPGADKAAFETNVNEILKDYPTAELQTPDEFAAVRRDKINQITQVIYALLFLAIIIALLGIANTLALSVYERRHEIGLLRAVGMTRRQVRSSVRWEAVIIALLGTVLGLVIGIGSGAAIVRSLRSLGFTGFAIPVGQPSSRGSRRATGRRRGDPARSQGREARHPLVDQDRVTVAGYSGTPLAKKLGLTEGAEVVTMGAPPDFGDLVDGVPVVATTRVPRRADVIVGFFTKRADLARRIEGCGKAIFPDGAMRVAWPKRASGVATDITEDTVREVALPLGLVDNKVCAIDDTWSALRVVWRRELRK